jgi:[glutamine synthetase] adenylyltransferase / [glutamine synthetase]-adenylyl-L-tyrosine phosphorylase
MEKTPEFWQDLTGKFDDKQPREALENELTSLGFYDGPSSFRYLRSLIANPSFEPARHWPDLLTAADPSIAARFLAAIGDKSADDLARLFEEKYFRHTCAAAGASEFLGTTLVRSPSVICELVNSAYLTDPKPKETILNEVEALIVPDMSDFMKAIRQYRRQEFFRIGLREIENLGTFEEIGCEISDFASATLSGALSVAWEIIGARYGFPSGMACTGVGHVNCGFVILGMGKLGGRELNFSSDIDLIFFHANDNKQTSGGESGAVDNRTFYGRLSEMIVKIIGENTAEGMVFRVDLNLRPDGKSGPISNTPDAAESYYEAFGQTWERAALVKAAPVAGDFDLGDHILDRLQPFIYRRLRDYDEINRLKSLKKKQHSSKSSRDNSKAFNVKLGKGGIREIEQIAVILQLLGAGKITELWLSNTLKCLKLLAYYEFLPEQDADKLDAAYRFLRKAEHLVQIYGDRQTHQLPTDEREKLTFARSAGFASFDLFQEALDSHTSGVSEIFDSLLEPRAIASGHSSERLLSAMRKGFYFNTLTEEIEQLFTRLAETLEREIDQYAEHQRLLYNLEKLCLAIGISFNYYSKLQTDEQLRGNLLTLFSTSDFLSNLFIGSPATIRRVFNEGYQYIHKTKKQLLDELHQAFHAEDEQQDQLEVLRNFKNRETLRIGLADIIGKISEEKVSAHLTEVADLALGMAYDFCSSALKTKHGSPRTDESTEAKFVIVGMGKLGGREMTYGSDLDLIFFYSGNGETDGEKKINNRDYFSRLAQRIIRFLTVQTREGFLYEIDNRLRPSGASGLLVTSLNGFSEYHKRSAAAWERQALLRARCVAGDSEFFEQVTEAINQVAYFGELSENLSREISHLRSRIEGELARENESLRNVKTGRGGLVDIEFALQYLQLLHGRTYPSLRQTNTLEALKAVQKTGLVEQKLIEDLETGYRFLRLTESRLRILEDKSIDDLHLESTALERLAERAGYRRSIVTGESAGNRFFADYENHTENIRQAYLRILDVDTN